MISLLDAASSSPVYQLNISLADFKPVIWRRVLVRGNLRLSRLNKVLQVVMGWQGTHLHQFEIGDQHYGQKDLDDEDPELKDERRYRLSDLGLQDGSVFIYRCDFGDNWEHAVLLEKKLNDAGEFKPPVCLEGRNACPTEDCGGVHGYQDMLKTLHHPKASGA